MTKRILWGLILIFLVGCTPPRVTLSQVTVGVEADGKIFQVQLPVGSTVQNVLDQVGIVLSNLDRVEPPSYTVLSDGDGVRVVRVTEEFEIEQVVIPFERQVLRNETLPEGESRLSQPGANGIQENTYRRVFEDGLEVSRSIVRTVVVQESVPEIMMVGSQTPYLSVTIPGRLVYLSGGNAWLMEGNTGNRRPIVSTGDLDGRIFNLSVDGRWLLYTRNMGDENQINSLWAARTDPDSTLVVDFKVANLIHFSQFGPDSITVAASTVEPRTTAPGWQANNDLTLIKLSGNGFLGEASQLIDVNSGGVYGWWGTGFEWGPELNLMAFTRPDGLGLVNLENGELSTLVELLPYQTGGDWAWVPEVNWSPDGRFLFTVDHVAPEGSAAPETSPQFDLVAVPVAGGPVIRLVTQVGMFASPVLSPQIETSTNSLDLSQYQVAYLQAITPEQSETSRYRLVVMDNDGSNRIVLFPGEGEPGLPPQEVVWSPEAINTEGTMAIAVVYQDNIWLINTQDGQAQQITGDGLISRIDWR
jgi:resuscitation-promoting factor RpfB